MQSDLNRKLIAYRERRELPERLAQIDGLEFLGFLEEGVALIPKRIYERFARYPGQIDDPVERRAAQPETALLYTPDPPPSILHAWLRACSEFAGISGICCLRLSAYSYVPWAEVRIDSRVNWLASLWDHFGGLYVVPLDRTRFLRLHTGISHYEAYIRDLDQVAGEEMSL